MRQHNSLAADCMIGVRLALHILLARTPAWRIHQGMCLASILGALLSAGTLLMGFVWAVPALVSAALFPWVLLLAYSLLCVQVALSFLFLITYLPLRPRWSDAPAGLLQFDNTIRLPDAVVLDMGAKVGEFIYFVSRDGYVSLVTGTQFDKLTAEAKKEGAET